MIDLLTDCLNLNLGLGHSCFHSCPKLSPEKIVHSRVRAILASGFSCLCIFFD